MVQLKALIIENIALAPGYYRIKFMAPEIAARFQPGQFIHVKVAGENCTDPLLFRPLSIYRGITETGTVELIYKIAGRGTAILAGKARGELLEVIGPLGTGFRVPETAKHLLLVGGGVGMPPLYCLAETVKARRPEATLTLFYGGRTQQDLLELDDWKRLGVKIYPATEDGSYGSQGLVTTVLAAQLDRLAGTGYDYLAACGPKPMLQAVQQLAVKHRINGELSLEAQMACGIGACLGCTCQTEYGYRRVCADGPVFNLREVNLDV
ncbi:MAG TPA: dihydroorotate dehydrogenase electron transfer subunit [Bacillota bacterium]